MTINKSLKTTKTPRLEKLNTMYNFQKIIMLSIQILSTSVKKTETVIQNLNLNRLEESILNITCKKIMITSLNLVHNLHKINKLKNKIKLMIFRDMVILLWRMMQQTIRIKEIQTSNKTSELETRHNL